MSLSFAWFKSETAPTSNKKINTLSYHLYIKLSLIHYYYSKVKLIFLSVLKIQYRVLIILNCKISLIISFKTAVMDKLKIISRVHKLLNIQITTVFWKKIWIRSMDWISCINPIITTRERFKHDHMKGLNSTSTRIFILFWRMHSSSGLREREE